MKRKKNDLLHRQRERAKRETNKKENEEKEKLGVDKNRKYEFG